MATRPSSRAAGDRTPARTKRPRSSFIRFEAALPNELWQTDATHWLLPGERTVEILNIIDDHSRLLVASVAFDTVKAADVVAVFQYPQAEAFPGRGIGRGVAWGVRPLFRSTRAHVGRRGLPEVNAFSPRQIAGNGMLKNVDSHSGTL